MSFYHKKFSRGILKKFTCLGENSKKHITFTVWLEKEATEIAKNWEEITKYLSYMLQFITSTQFMASSLSNLNNLSDVIHKIKCKYRHDDKKCETYISKL